MRRRHRGRNPPPHTENSAHLHPAGLHRINKVVENLVRHLFMKRPLIAVRPEIEFVRLQLEAFFVGDIAGVNGGKIGLPRFGAQTGEFGAFAMDDEIALRVWVWKNLDLPGWSCGHGGDIANRPIDGNRFKD